MNITYRGFLRLYCRELTELNTDSLKKLCSAVNDSAPHAAEAVFLFALEQGKVEHLLALSKGTWMERLYGEAAARVSLLGSAEAFLYDETTSERFRKVRNAYEAKLTKIDSDRRVISLMREKTLSAIEGGGLTVYRICKDLELNQGNVYAYLNKGDLAKVSRGTARQLLEHTLSLTAPRDRACP